MRYEISGQCDGELGAQVYAMAQEVLRKQPEPKEPDFLTAYHADRTWSGE
jgi:hypothetical protein